MTTFAPAITQNARRYRPLQNGGRQLPLSLLSAFFCLMFAIGLTTPLEFPWSPDNATTTTAGHVSLTEHGSPTREGAVVLIAILSAYVLFNTRPLRPAKPNMISLLLTLFVLWAPMSLLWADDRGLAVKRVLVYLLLYLAVIALAAALSYYQLAVFAAVGCSAVIGLAIVTDLVIGRFMPLDPDYRLAGVLQPNDLGQYCAVLLFALICLARGQRHRALVGGGIVFGVISLLLTRSITSIVSSAAAVLFVLALIASRRTIALVTTALMVILVWLSLSPLRISSNTLLTLEHSGNRSDSTLQARIDLWREAAEYIQRRPLLGYGYGGFWTPQRIDTVASDQGWNLGSAHSEYVETALQLGVLAPVLYLGLLVGTLVFAIQAFRRTGHGGFLFTISMCIWMIITSFTESMELGPVIPVLVGYALLIKLGAFTSFSRRSTATNGGVECGV